MRIDHSEHEVRSERVVLDTSVLYSALRSSVGASHHIVRNLDQPPVTVIISAPVLLEYESVLTRSESLDDFGLTRPEVLRFLGPVVRRMDPVHVYFRWRPNLIDEADNLFVECAVAGQCDYLVTLNTRHFTSGELGPFGFQVITPGDFLQHLRRKEG